MASKKSSYERLLPPLIFYGEFHANTVNQLIHIVFVPTILVTFFMMFNLIALPQLPASVASFMTAVGLPATVALPLALFYIVFYSYLCPNMLGVSAALLVLAALVLADTLVIELGRSTALYAAVVINVGSWVAQFYGHGVHEKRRPALIDNLFQSFAMAPLFVYIELLFKFGLLKGLKKEMQPEVSRRVKAYRASLRSQ